MDHIKQFKSLSVQIANNCHSITTVLESRDCPNLKSTVEKLTEGLMQQQNEDEEKLKKKYLTFSALETWYRDNYEHSEKKPSLVIMIANFEQFDMTSVQDLIEIMCSYSKRLPIVLLVGITTAFKALHNILPPRITDKMSTSIFQAETATVMLNKILEKVILTPHSPVQLSGKALKILMDIFLFYDYSLHNFVKGYKTFMLEHFCNRPLSSLVIRMDDDGLSHADCETIRRTCQSFRSLVESSDPKTRIELITNDDFLRKNLADFVMNFRSYLFYFYCCLRILVILIDDLPRNELGTQLRELYPICISTDITKLEDYKECFKLLRFTSKDKFLNKMDKISSTVQASLSDEKTAISQKTELAAVLENLAYHHKKISEAGMSPQKEVSRSTPKITMPSSEVGRKNTNVRQEMLAKLEENAKKNPSRVIIEYERSLWHCLDYLNSLMEKYLRPIQQAPQLYEFFVMNDCQSVRRQILGAPRGSMNNALTNPQHYLQCQCCYLTENELIIPSLPDTCVAYKLHLESSKFINLYDWLQAFSTVVETNEDDDDEIKPEVQ